MAHTCNSSIRETREGAMLEPDSLSYRVGAKRNRKCWRDGSTVKSALSEIPSLFSIIHTGVPQLLVTPALGNPMPSSGSHRPWTHRGLAASTSWILGLKGWTPMYPEFRFLWLCGKRFTHYPSPYYPLYFLSGHKEILLPAASSSWIPPFWACGFQLPEV